MVVVDIARDVTKVFSEVIGWNTMRTLRLNNHDLWVLPHGSTVSVFGPNGRRLRLEEKEVLTGLPRGTLRRLDLHAAETALGNTMPVPLIGTVMAPVLAAWSLYSRQRILEESFRSRAE